MLTEILSKWGPLKKGGILEVMKTPDGETFGKSCQVENEMMRHQH